MGEQICVGEVYVDQGATASDNFDDDEELTQNIMVSGLPLDTSATGVFTILYEVVDTAGNVAEPKSRVVQVTDDPSICSEMGKCPFCLPACPYLFWISRISRKM